MEKDIENLIEQLTKVRPSMLNEEALKLFNTIMIILDERDKLKNENKQLKEYIFVAPNLDEMTAVKYSHIQRDAYFRGRSEEQQKAEQIIHENYIPKSKIKEKIKELNKRIEQYDEYSKQRIETDVEFYENIADTTIVQVLQELMGDK